MDWHQLFNDFRQKYEGCWCTVLIEGHTIENIFHLDLVENVPGKAPLLHLRNSQLGEIILKYDDSKSDIHFVLPSIGLYNSKTGVIMARRNYGRQWKKGLCTGTVRLISIYGLIDELFNMLGETRLDETLVKILLKPTSTLTLEGAISKLKTRIAVCLSSEFALGLSLNEKTPNNYILWYYENPIGIVEYSSKRILLREPQFEQEFKDFANNMGGTSGFTIHI
jgi:hypothetical protein